MICSKLVKLFSHSLVSSVELSRTFSVSLTEANSFYHHVRLLFPKMTPQSQAITTQGNVFMDGTFRLQPDFTIHISFWKQWEWFWDVFWVWFLIFQDSNFNLVPPTHIFPSVCINRGLVGWLVCFFVHFFLMYCRLSWWEIRQYEDQAEFFYFILLTM